MRWGQMFWIIDLPAIYIELTMYIKKFRNSWFGMYYVFCLFYKVFPRMGSKWDLHYSNPIYFYIVV